jgi:SAM-dependent methyltransferase
MRPTLTDVFMAHTGRVSDKWEHYLAIYDREVGSFRDASAPVRLLEIGVQNGGSLEVWSKFLPPGSSVVGIDIDQRCGELTFSGDITVLIGDAADSATLDRLVGTQVFDVIVDDGSHVSRDIIATLQACFPRLRPGGIFLIEDLHASYWASHGGGFRAEGAAIEWLKGLVDALHTDYLEASVPGDARASLAALNSEIARIAFYDSVAVIEKLPAAKTTPYRRVLSGTQADVVGGAAVLPAPLVAHPGSLVLASATAGAVAAADVLHTNDTAQLQAARDTAAAAMADAAAARAHLAAIEASMSWRITAPLRRLAGMKNGRKQP